MGSCSLITYGPSDIDFESNHSSPVVTYLHLKLAFFFDYIFVFGVERLQQTEFIYLRLVQCVLRVEDFLLVPLYLPICI